MTDGEKQQEIEARIEELAVSFSEKLPIRIDEIRQFFNDQISVDNYNVEGLLEMHQLVHAFAGTAGTFGYKKIYQYSRDLETTINEMIRTSPNFIDDAFIKSIRDKITLIDDTIRKLTSIKNPL